MKNGSPFGVIALVAMLAAAPVAAEEIVRLETRPGVSVRMAVEEPPSPAGGVILFAGGNGRLKLDRNTKFLNKTGNFAIRVRHRFFRAGYTVVSVDVPSDRRNVNDFRPSEEHGRDIGRIVAWLRRTMAGPVWLIGHSRGSISAANGAARLGLPPAGPDGIVLMASVTETSKDGKPTIYDVPLDRIGQPAIVLHHRDDQCYVTPLYGAIALAKRLDSVLIRIEGGTPPVARPRQSKSQHGFFGREAEAIEKVIAAMKAALPN